MNTELQVLLLKLSLALRNASFLSLSLFLTLSLLANLKKWHLDYCHCSTSMVLRQKKKPNVIWICPLPKTIPKNNSLRDFLALINWKQAAKRGAGGTVQASCSFAVTPYLHNIFACHCLSLAQEPSDRRLLLLSDFQRLDLSYLWSDRTEIKQLGSRMVDGECIEEEDQKKDGVIFNSEIKSCKISCWSGGSDFFLFLFSVHNDTFPFIFFQFYVRPKITTLHRILEYSADELRRCWLIFKNSNLSDNTTAWFIFTHSYSTLRQTSSLKCFIYPLDMWVIRSDNLKCSARRFI